MTLGDPPHFWLRVLVVATQRTNHPLFVYPCLITSPTRDVIARDVIKRGVVPTREVIIRDVPTRDVITRDDA